MEKCKTIYDFPCYFFLMILTKSKTWAEIQQAINQYHLQKVGVISCGSCSAQCGTGGTVGLEKITKNLIAKNYEIVASMIIEEPCDKRAIKNNLKHLGKDLDNIDGFIVASCGSGAQAVAEVSEKPTIVTTDTIMIAQTEKIGVYHERCRACGQCLLNETGGICPITACAKSLLNGPCGGVIDGKCEVGNYSQPCGWVAIYNRLKKLGQLENFMKYRPPRDWSLETRKNEVNVRAEMKNYYGCDN